MSVSAEAEPQHVRDVFDQSTRLRISQIGPDVDSLGPHHIAADVALVWPYSSSTKCLSLLLAEKDVHLRKSKGQVKITIRGACAQKVANTRVGIGDHVRLDLRDVAWVRIGEQVSTPGKKADWDIDIASRVKIEIQQGNQTPQVVDFAPTEAATLAGNGSIVEIEGPKRNGSIYIRNAHQSSPHFSPVPNRHRLSGSSFFEATLDPFADDDGYIKGKGRKRTKFARPSGTWQLLDDKENNSEEGDGSKEQVNGSKTRLQPTDASRSESALAELERQTTPESILDSDVSVVATSVQVQLSPTRGTSIQTIDTEPRSASMANSTAPQAPQLGSMPPPPIFTPGSKAAQLQGGILSATQDSTAPTPVLRPLPSTGLSLVSPLVEYSGLATSYFPIVNTYKTGHNGINETANFPTSSSVSVLDGSSADLDLAPSGTVEVHDLEDKIVPDTESDSAELLDSSNVRGERQMNDAPETLDLDSSGNVEDRLEEINQTSQFVDLDNLQRQIEQSAQQFEDGVSEHQAEDEDLYGPPIDSNKSLEQGDNGSGYTNDIQHYDFRRPPVSTWSQDQVPIPQQVDIDEFGADTLRGREESLSPQNGHHVQSSVSRGADDQYGAEFHQLHEVQYDDHDGVAGPKLEVHIEPQNAGAIATTMQSFDEDFVQFDGVTEARETREERVHARTGTTTNQHSFDPEVIEVLSIPSEPSSVLVEDDGGHEVLEEVVDQVQAAEKDQANDEMIDDIPSLPVSDQTLGLVEDLTMPLTTDVFVERLQGQKQSVYEKGTIGIPSPQATQEHEGQDTSVSVPADKSTLVLPPTPGPTQKSTDGDITPASNLVNRTLIPDGNEDTLSVTKPSSGKGRLARRVSQRLPRKLVTTDIVPNDYFTPRRSARIIQTSHSSLPSSSPTRQPISPIWSRKDTKTSPTIAADEQTEQSKHHSILRYGISTPLSYYPYLSTLGEHLNQSVDVIAVCSADSTPAVKAKAGPRDWYTTLHLADSSLIDNNTTITAQIFRVRKDALPSTRSGNVILLRSMKVQSQRRTPMLMSTDVSAWAVFAQESNQAIDAVVSGPPVEYDKAEKAAADELHVWWAGQEAKDYPEPSPDARDTGKLSNVGDSPRIMTRSRRRQANQTDNFENEYDQHDLRVGDITQGDRDNDGRSPELPLPSTASSVVPQWEDLASPTTSHKSFSRRRRSSRRSESVVHELRDGTKYVDDGEQRGASVIHELRDGSSYIDD